MYILGISAYYHDSAACLIHNGNIISAAQEERFTRIKHDPRFPIQAIKYCINNSSISFDEIESIVFYDKPLLKFERLLETYLAEAPKGLKSFLMSIPVWLKDKLFLKSTIAKELSTNFDVKKSSVLPKILFTEHHISHSASAFYPSPFKDSAILTIDGVGEWSTTSLSHGSGNNIEIISEIHFPHSLGLLYSAFTYYTGFKVNSGEYKIMGLAPYGEPVYLERIKEHLIDIKEDGSFKLNMDYFNFNSGLTMTNSKFHDLFGGAPRQSETEVTQKEMNIARSIQELTEEIVILLAKNAKLKTNSENLCLAGGVALNCVANGKLLKNNIFKNIWIQPAAGDAGGALGAALFAYHTHFNNARVISEPDAMKGAYLGPQTNSVEIETMAKKYNAKFQKFTDEESLYDLVSDHLINEKVVGWHQGRMEFGPRALGGRSILGDPRSTKMQSIMNLKIKYRESFRPFAPSILIDELQNWFDIDVKSPYMLLVADINDAKKIIETEETEKLFGIDKLKIPRSTIPAITHVDYSARIQTVSKDTNPKYYGLINSFHKKTSCPVLVNTSFNVRGEPIVCTAEDSYKCFMRTEMDVLVIENYIFYKNNQPNYDDKEKWQEKFRLD
ncbi:carbamoyltransferase [Candidatus Kapabacteria bacterium]|nr:carbamoyltransferase [Candidatus Kapabacteria bacterium]